VSACNKRASLGGLSHFATMTSLALTMASTSSPLANARSSAASLVMDDVDDDAAADIDSHMGGRLAFLDLDDFALELVSRAELCHAFDLS
jgi:hypothetical protein